MMSEKRHLPKRNWECRGCEKPKSHQKPHKPAKGRKAKKPRSREAKKPKSQEAKKPRSQEAKKPRSQEAQKPRSQEAQKPRSREAKKPRSRKAKKPRSREAKKPRSQEAKKPRSQEAKSQKKNKKKKTEKNPKINTPPFLTNPTRNLVGTQTQARMCSELEIHSWSSCQETPTDSLIRDVVCLFLPLGIQPPQTLHKLEQFAQVVFPTLSKPSLKAAPHHPGELLCIFSLLQKTCYHS